jgi:hypothetical protein
MVVATRSKKKVGISKSRARNIFLTTYDKAMRDVLHFMHGLFKECIVNQVFIRIVARPSEEYATYRMSLRIVDRQRMRLLREIIHDLQTMFKKLFAALKMRSAKKVFKYLLVTFFRYIAVAKGQANPIGQDGGPFEQDLIERCAYGDERTAFFLPFLERKS